MNEHVLQQQQQKEEQNHNKKTFCMQSRWIEFNHRCVCVIRSVCLLPDGDSLVE